jgi:hypothetical protein
MKLRNVCSVVGLLLAVSAVQVNAGGEVCIQILCIETKLPVAKGLPVVITSIGAECDIPSVETDGNGQACFEPCVANCYDVTVLGQTKEFCVSTPTPIEVSCAGGPVGGCPECVNPDLGLGAAAGCTVLELSTAKVSITGPAGGIFGDICIAPGGKLSMSGDEFVTGTIRLGEGATFNNSSHGMVTVEDAVLTGEIDAAKARATTAAGLSCDQSFDKLDGKTVTEIVGGSGINVICVGDVVLSGKQITLKGPADALFIFNVTNKFVLTGGGDGPQIRVDISTGLLPNNVLYNILGSGPDVAFSGGGGGLNCCAAIVDGTLLAPDRKINLSPGLVNGQVISGKDINIVSGASVVCPCPKK